MQQVIISVEKVHCVVLHVQLPSGSGKQKDWLTAIKTESSSAQMYRTIGGILLLISPSDVERVIDTLKRLSAERSLEIVQAEGVKVVEDGDLLT